MRAPGSLVTEKDRLLLRALRAFEAGLCGGCGQHKDDSMNPDHDGADPAHTARYEVGLWECLACAAIARRQRGYANADVPLDGIQYSVELIPRRRPMTATPHD